MNIWLPMKKISNVAMFDFNETLSFIQRKAFITSTNFSTWISYGLKTIYDGYAKKQDKVS